MRVRLPLKEFQLAANTVCSVARAATPMPVLLNVLLVAEKGLVRMESTDIETLVVATVPGTIEAEGRTTIEAARLLSLAKLLPSGAEVSISADAGKATIVCENNEYKLQTLPADDFPEWANEKRATKFRMEQRKLRDMLAVTEYAIATGREARRILFGIYVEVFDNTLRLTATDGKKLSRVHTSLAEVEGTQPVAIILPSKPAAELRKALGDEGPVEIEMSARQISFKVGNLTFYTQGIEGKYPDCDVVIPKDFPHEVLLDRDRFISAVKRAGVVANDMNRSIVLKLESNVCEFSAMAFDIGSFAGRMPIEYNGEPLRLAFNCEYLVETLGGFTDVQVRMLVKSSNAPTIFKTAKDMDRLALLMPIKLTSVPMAGAENPDEEE